MKTENQKPASIVPHTFTPEELERMQKYFEFLSEREELIGELDKHAGFFPEWLKLINEAILMVINKKQEIKSSGEDDREMLININHFFGKMSSFGNLISIWHKELVFSKENTEQMIKQGHP